MTQALSACWYIGCKRCCTARTRAALKKPWQKRYRRATGATLPP